MKTITQILFTFTMISQCCMLSAATHMEIDLAGEWGFSLDPENQGIEDHWYAMDFDKSLNLPGSLQAQGFGNDVGPNTPWVGLIREETLNVPKYLPYLEKENFKFPFWLQPEKYYRGAAWYQREVIIPSEWDDKRIELHLERAHWETAVWVDGRKIGSKDSLSTAHIYELPETLSAGKHSLVIRVDNQINMNVGVNSHSISDHTQSNWNGIVGDIKLVAMDLVWMDDVQVYTNAIDRTILVKVRMGNQSGSATKGKITLSAKSEYHLVAPRDFSIDIPCGESDHTLNYSLGSDAILWDEFNPFLYDLETKLTASLSNPSSRTVTFGLRDVGIRGSQFTINDRPVFLRGTLECAIFPLTGYPPTDTESWRRIIQICKDYGLNHMRFHSWCPPEAAFVAADELGFYYQVECASWANQGATIGDGNLLDNWLYDEAARITKAYGNHPSFILMAYGNEPGGKHRVEYLQKWCNYWKEHEPRMLHTSGAGWPLVEESDFYNYPKPRIQQWGEGLNSIINSKPPQTQFDYLSIISEYPEKPTISHEIGQWCVYPNFEEISKYTGVLKPKNFEIFRDFLDQAQMGNQANDFLMASGKLQALCYKADIEAALRTSGFGGFQLLDLHDFPGQGTALVGILDPFWESKGYITAEEHRQYCSPTVPLAKMEKMVWTNRENLRAKVEIAHFAPYESSPVTVFWNLKTVEDHVVDEGVFENCRIESGKNNSIGAITSSLSKVTDPAKLILTIECPELEACNSWDLWCYPFSSKQTVNESMYITHELDNDAVRELERGGDVLLLIPPSDVNTDVELGFSSIFWNTAWTRGQAPHTLGILCEPKHPALKDFPTDFHSNWQWWDLVTNAATMELDDFPSDLLPIVQVVPDWFDPKRLALLFEAKVKNGKLLISSMDLQDDLRNRPVARQMRLSILNYMRGRDFSPDVELSPEDIQSIFVKNK